MIKKVFIYLFVILAAIYILICALMYFRQESLIFFPEKLSKDFTFSFNQPFEELSIKTADNTRLNGLLFKAQNTKGLIFYLHGNAGSLRSWGDVAQTYTDLNYDVFILDYRGYGKSGGRIKSQEQFFDDVQLVYDIMKQRYTEDKIVILGYSIGTGAAAKTASVNNPKLLILQAPYYSLSDMVKHMFPALPVSILKYKFETNKYIKECKMPVILFHGDQDEVIYYGSSLKLKELMKSIDQLITLHGQRHNGMTENADYINEIRKILR